MSGPIETKKLMSGPIETKKLMSGPIETKKLMSGPIETKIIKSCPLPVELCSIITSYATYPLLESIFCEDISATPTQEPIQELEQEISKLIGKQSLEEELILALEQAIIAVEEAIVDHDGSYCTITSDKKNLISEAKEKINDNKWNKHWRLKLFGKIYRSELSLAHHKLNFCKIVGSTIYHELGSDALKTYLFQSVLDKLSYIYEGGKKLKQFRKLKNRTMIDSLDASWLL